VRTNGCDVIEPTHFRNVLGCFATGVTIVTAMDDGEPVGMAVNSFTSVSLDPPLVAFCPAKSSSTWQRIRNAQAFCVNILGQDHEEVCRAFAMPGADRFGCIAWTTGASGSPLLDGVMASIDCRIEAEHDAGDHVIVVGGVLELSLPSAGRPLLFYRGGYGRLHSVHDDDN
jgi:3-hydroxy-9,10-secoandrosta-1,3,5(10)-triene-9,17-dione monooxygenase reductase component